MKKLSILTASLTLGLLGCGTPPNQQSKAENKGNFAYLGSKVQDRVEFTELEKTSLPDGRLEVHANIINRVNQPLEIQMSCQFKNQQGITIDETPFKVKDLDARGQKTFTFTSLKKAEKFTVIVRLSR